MVLTPASWRLWIVAVFGLLLTLSLLWRIATLQVVDLEPTAADERPVVDFEFLQEQGNRRTLRKQKIPAIRGMILDRRGEPLAVSTSVVTLWINPKVFEIEAGEISQLASVLGLREKNVLQQIKKYKAAGKQFMYLAREIQPAVAETVKALNIKGLNSLPEHRRYYPSGEVVSQVVGLTNIDDLGIEGLELSLNSYLQGEDGQRLLMKDLKGRIVKEVKLIRGASSGETVALSLDIRLQYEAFKQLKSAVKSYAAKSGSIVLLNPSSGEVLALANYPSFNPNIREKIDPNSARNRAVTDVFEPGSTVKPLTALAALESGKYTPGTIVNTAPGYFRVANKTLLDPTNYGPLTLTGIIAKSSQVGISKVALDLPAEFVKETFVRFGFGSGTGVEVPGEQVGTMPLYSKWRELDRATFSFGYGLSANALQVAAAYGVLANGGVKVPVTILNRDEVLKGERVAKLSHVKQINEMLKVVASVKGTGRRAQIVGFNVAGKSGTVHKVSRSEHGYSDNQYLSLFAGFAPVENPQVVAVVVIDEPTRGGYYGGEVAAPVFASVMRQALRIMQVQPNVQELKDSVASLQRGQAG